jgi:antitoxin VapB
MAINIKNERTVALARELAEVRGVTLTSAIEEALERRLKELQDEPSPREARAAERHRKITAILAEIHANITPEQREALRTAEQDMYDEDGLPIW